MTNWIGKSLGNYKLVSLLDVGGYAEVYKGEHIHLGTHAAVKILRTFVTGDDIDVFRNEARIIASLAHPNIIRVLDFGIQDGTPFLVMEYAQKGSLKGFRTQGHPLPYIVILSYINQVASALQYAHDQKNLIHRDVKPANMLRLNDDRIVLSDFGIASIAQGGQKDIVGTISYMAPEQILGQAVLASDQYALGIVVYEWLSGDLPFKGNNQEICDQHLHMQPPALSGRVPATIESVILRALTKDPKQRFPRVKDFADELKNAYMHAAQEAQNTTRPIPFIAPTISISTSTGFDAKTVFLSTRADHAITSVETQISHYDELLRTFHQLNRERMQALQSVQQRFEQERAYIDATLQREQEQAISGLKRVREAVRTSQENLDKNGWRNVISKTRVPEINGPVQLERMPDAQRSALDAGHEIQSGIARYQDRSRIFRRAMAFILRAVIVIVLLSIAYAALAWFLQLFGTNLGSFGPGILILCVVLVASFLLITGLFWLRNRNNISKSLHSSYATLMRASATVEAMGAKRNEVLQNTRRSRFADFEYRYNLTCQGVEQNLQRSLSQYIPTIKRYINEDGLPVAEWDDPRWLRWQQHRQATSLMRLGVIKESDSFPPLPALAICPGGENILFKIPGAAKEYAVQALQSLMLRLLTSQPPGKLRFTLIDPTGLGKNVATFLQLADYDEQLISGKVWTRKEQIAQQLVELSDHMENVIQQYLRNQYSSIDEYNKVAGEIAEPYRVLVVVGFPTNFNKETANLLTNIAATGSRCGVSVMMIVDVEQPLPSGFKLAELERVARIITWDNQGFNWIHKDLGSLKLHLDTLPRPEIFGQLLSNIGEEAIKARQRVEIPFRLAIEQHIIPEYRWWASDQSTGEEIVVPLGRKGASKYQYLSLGKGIAHHVLIAGTTGSGKTTLLHDLIVGLSLIYNPDEMEFYLIDFKNVGFAPYAHHKLPHARVIAIQSEREYGLSVLEGLEEEIEERRRSFKEAHVQDLSQFRRIQPRIRMPRILLIIDEFQELFIRQDDIATKAAEHLNRFVRTGRGFGIHVILASQTLAGLSTLGRPTLLDISTMSQMAVRIALKNEKADSRLILSEDNTSSGLLFQFRPGEAIYNADSGAEASNSRFQSFWLSDDELSVYLEAIRRLGYSHDYVPAHIQNIFDGSKNADLNENTQLNDLLASPSWHEQQHPIIWLGDPISLKDPTNIQLRAHRGSNVLIVGQDEIVAPGLLTIAQYTLAAQHHPKEARFYIVDERLKTPYIDRLREREKLMPHEIKIADRYTLAALLTEIYDEIKERMDKGTIQKPQIYLFINGLHLIRAFRQERETGSNQAKLLSTILRDGPEQHVHTLIWCDMVNNFTRAMELSMLDEFEFRVAFQMSESDSTKLLGSTLAKMLDSHRVLLSSQGTIATEKFIPYESPSDEWLVHAGDCIRQKSLQMDV